jgi:hypothetical protein
VLTDLSILVQDAEIQASGVEIDATIKLVLLGVESPEVSSSFFDGEPNASIPRGMRRRGPQ